MHIGTAGQAVTAITLKGRWGIDQKTFDVAIDYGVSRKRLKWSTHGGGANYYAVPETLAMVT